MKASKLNLALSGDPGLGSYVWGALDALLAEPRVAITGISAVGISAVGAAIVAASAAHGRLAARQALAELWYEVVHGDWPVPVVPPSRLGELDFDHVLDAFAAIPGDPLEPLQELVRRRLDFDALRRGPISLHVSATDIDSGRLRVFGADELTPAVLLASVAAPFCTPPVRIDDRFYWGGGFGGDPAIFPLLYESKSNDVMLVTRNPLIDRKPPEGSAATFSRIWNWSSRQALDAELRSILFVQRLMAQGRLDTAEYLPVHLHRVGLELGLVNPPASANRADHVLQMRSLGVSDVERWFADHMGDLGRRSTFDIEAILRGDR